MNLNRGSESDKVSYVLCFKSVIDSPHNTECINCFFDLQTQLNKKMGFLPTKNDTAIMYANLMCILKQPLEKALLLLVAFLQLSL